MWNDSIVATESHLQMIQAVVARLSAQSTTIKGWCVTVTAALLSFGANATTPVICAIALYVVVAFAVLDAYYLTLERAHRRLYEQVVRGTAERWTFAIGRPTFREVLRAAGSPSILLLYGTSLAATIGVTIYIAGQ